MGYKKAHYDFTSPKNPAEFAGRLGLKNLGITIYRFRRGEGADFFHNHREQEEIYLCLAGEADLLIAGTPDEHLKLKQGDIVKVEPGTSRAVGNISSDEALVLVAGACPHPYPAGLSHHDVIADVLSISGEGKTPFRWPQDLPQQTLEQEDEEC